MAQVTFQVVSQGNFMSKFRDPNFWRTYRLYVLQEITEKAAEVVRQHAARVWRNPTGALDQSWFSTIDPVALVGSIQNSKPYAYWLNYGVRPHKMVYLLNARNAYEIYYADGRSGKAAVIPIRLAGGGTQFRIVTERQMTQNPGGKPWFHKGITPKRFLEEGTKTYVDHHLRDDYQGLVIRVLGL